jgi:hypothetical protein
MLYNNNVTVCKKNFLFLSFHSFYSRGLSSTKTKISSLFNSFLDRKIQTKKKPTRCEIVTLKDDFVKVEIAIYIILLKVRLNNGTSAYVSIIMQNVYHGFKV